MNHRRPLSRVLTALATAALVAGVGAMPANAATQHVEAASQVASTSVAGPAVPTFVAPKKLGGLNVLAVRLAKRNEAMVVGGTYPIYRKTASGSLVQSSLTVASLDAGSVTRVYTLDVGTATGKSLAGLNPKSSIVKMARCTGCTYHVVTKCKLVIKRGQDVIGVNDTTWKSHPSGSVHMETLFWESYALVWGARKYRTTAVSTELWKGGRKPRFIGMADFGDSDASGQWTPNPTTSYIYPDAFTRVNFMKGGVPCTAESQSG